MKDEFQRWRSKVDMEKDLMPAQWKCACGLKILQKDLGIANSEEPNEIMWFVETRTTAIEKYDHGGNAKDL